jgi:hypothetical protein
VLPSTYAWEAPCSNDAVLLGVRVSRPRIDESTYDWCNHITAKHVNRQPFPPTSERISISSLVPRCCEHPIAQSGCSETDSWALSKAARVEM